jgi:hypothetical protein
MIGITALRDGCWHIKCVHVVNWAHNQERARERKERTSEFRQEEERDLSGRKRSNIKQGNLKAPHLMNGTRIN